MQKPLSVLLAILLIAGVAAEPAKAQTPLITVTAQYQVVPGGYRYYLTVDNQTNPADDYHVYFLTLGVFYPSGVYNTPFDLVSPPAPWHGIILNGGTSDRVDWSISDTDRPPNWHEGIAPGQSLSGFAFTSETWPERIAYSAVAYKGSDGTWNSGDLYPEPVPEPTSLLALGGGALVLIGFARRRRRR